MQSSPVSPSSSETSPAEGTARATVTIAAPVARVWQALVKPELVKRFMFGTTLTTDWKVGAPITWAGAWKGKPYEDRGTVLVFEPGRRLGYTHWSPLSGKPDTEENLHVITISCSGEGGRTHVVLTQTNNHDEKERAHSEKNWSTMLESLKTFVESS